LSFGRIASDDPSLVAAGLDSVVKPYYGLLQTPAYCAFGTHVALLHCVSVLVTRRFRGAPASLTTLSDRFRIISYLQAEKPLL
ncbi:MAG: hypothetical protein ACK5QI_03900, partial [Alphaproteobacteria bacterium]